MSLLFLHLLELFGDFWGGEYSWTTHLPLEGVQREGCRLEVSSSECWSNWAVLRSKLGHPRRCLVHLGVSSFASAEGWILFRVSCALISAIAISCCSFCWFRSALNRAISSNAFTNSCLTEQLHHWLDGSLPSDLFLASTCDVCNRRICKNWQYKIC